MAKNSVANNSVKHIGRIGALAVALGVGAALASSPAIAYAAPADSGSPASDASGDSTAASDPTESSGPTSAASTAPSKVSSRLTRDSATDSPARAERPDRPDAPRVVVRSSGGARTSATATEEDAVGQQSNIEKRLSRLLPRVSSAVEVDPETALDDPQETIPTPTPASKSDDKPNNRSAPDMAQESESEPVAAAVRWADPASTLTDIRAAAERRLSTATVAVRPAAAATAPAQRAANQGPALNLTPEAAVQPAIPQLSKPPADPVTTRTTTISGLLATALAPVLTPGPDAPMAPSPALLAVLGMMRRDFEAPSLLRLDAVPPAIVQQRSLQLVNVPGNPFSLTPEAVIGAVVDAVLNAVVDVRNFLVATFVRPAPDAYSQQFILDTSLNPSVTAQFDATTIGHRLVYTVNERGTPGGPRHGTVVVNGDTFTYTPDPGFSGADTFTYVADDNTPFDLHFHGFNSFNSAFGIFGTSFLGGHRDSATVTVFVDQADTSTITGELTAVTYNIAGLPFPINFLLNDTTTQPRFTSTWEMSKRLNQTHLAAGDRPVVFDLVGIQEDFAFNPFLMAATVFPNATAPQFPPGYLWPLGVPFIAGLNTLSAYELRNTNRVSFNSCASFNCLTPKGFTYKQMQLPGGETVDVYNLHLDSGGFQTTNQQIAQLSAYIQQNSAGRAVIVTGDWNQRYSQDDETLTQFAADNGLTDAWVLQEYGGTAPIDAPTCDNGNDCEQLDKIFFRSAAATVPGDDSSRPVILELLTDGGDYVGYQNFGTAFEASDGTPLADHRPIAATLVYTVRNNGTPIVV